MANIISDETIEYVGILAKLELSAEDKENAKKDIGEMLDYIDRKGDYVMKTLQDYIDKLNELDTSGVEPMSHAFPVNNVFREDVPKDQDGREKTLSNAPERGGDSFVVPKTI